MEYILYLAVLADRTVQAKKRLIMEEKCIRFAQFFLTFYIFATRLFGLVIQFHIIRSYTELNIPHMSSVEEIFEIYTLLKLGEATILIGIMLPIWPVLIYKMWKNHRSEFKYHGFGVILITLCIILYRLGDIEVYIYITTRFLYFRTAEDDKRIHLSPSYIAWTILGIAHLFVPSAIVLFKKDKDIF
jgi:hypothetical protein